MEFARAVLERAERNDLLDQSGPTKQEFITYLEEGLVERDFREPFYSLSFVTTKMRKVVTHHVRKQKYRNILIRTGTIIYTDADKGQPCTAGRTKRWP